MKLYGVVGWKNSGKTGLMERLVAEFVSRGLTVSTVKHAHAGFEADQPGRDSYRHRAAGASEVLLTGGGRWALFHEGDDEPSLDSLLQRLSPTDLVLVEGFKTGHHPKVEAHRAETGQPLIATDDLTVRAIASNNAATIPGRAVFALDDTAAIADFIAAELAL